MKARPKVNRAMVEGSGMASIVRRGRLATVPKLRVLKLALIVSSVAKRRRLTFPPVERSPRNPDERLRV